MGEGYYGVSDEFIMFVIVPVVMLTIGLIGKLFGEATNEKND